MLTFGVRGKRMVTSHRKSFLYQNTIILCWSALRRFARVPVLLPELFSPKAALRLTLNESGPRRVKIWVSESASRRQETQSGAKIVDFSDFPMLLLFDAHLDRPIPQPSSGHREATDLPLGMNLSTIPSDCLFSAFVENELSNLVKNLNF